MDSISINYEPLAHDFFPFFKVWKDGRVERYTNIPKIPPSVDFESGVGSKDVVISSEPAISARLFMPCVHDPNKKLPLLVYYHGGGFCVGSAFGQNYHNCLNSLVAKANVVAVSVEYRLAPEQPMSVCYDDSWEALKWVALHIHMNGPETWLNNYVDFKRVFLAGDSAGANIVYNMAVRVGSIGLPELNLSGLALVHPYFVGVDRYDRMCLYLMGRSCHGGLEDPRLNPDPKDVARIGCEKVLVFVGGRDHLREAGRCFYEELTRTRRVNVEIVEHEGEGHVFHLVKPLCQNAIDLEKRLVSFINQCQIELMSNM